MEMNKEHAMTAREIADELAKLIEQEKAEPGYSDESEDVKDLEDAHMLLEKFASEEESETEEKPEESAEAPEPMKGAVDTGVLTGPISGLKNFLMKKSQDNARQI